MVTTDRMPKARTTWQIMPGHQSLTYNGVSLTVSPDFWLRRWLKFPFFFENTNPTFRIDLERIRDAKGNPPGFMPQFTVLEDNGEVRQHLSEEGTIVVLTMPNLAVGEKARLLMPNVYGMSGRTNSIILALSPDGAEHLRLFWYSVKDEANLWLALVALIVAGFGALATLGVQKLLDQVTG